FNELSHL
nr:Chain B, T. brucei PGI PTS1 peptide Ac-FNELSHL [synthetic construct]